jgi:Rad3-related DNA helicase
MFFSLPEHLRKRKFIICDEGSELEKQLVSQFTCDVDLKYLVESGIELTSFPTSRNQSDVYEWLVSLMNSLTSKMKELEDIMKNSKSKSHEQNKKKTEYNRVNTLQRAVSLLVDTWYESEYIISTEDGIIKFIPFKVDKLAKMIFDCADHVIIMSATIIDPKRFCKNLGINEFELIETESIFDSKKAPIYVMTGQKLNFQNMKKMLPTIVSQIEGLLEEHKGEKGIIHTHTQYITDYLKDNVRKGRDRLLCRTLGVRNEDILNRHELLKFDSVLVSPSMTYGVDLKGDLAKFQIIVKAPWLPTKEPRTEKMMKFDESWYVNEMLKSVIQACGRGVRSPKDECVTYILDGIIYDTVHRNREKLPKYFLDRFQ